MATLQTIRLSWNPEAIPEPVTEPIGPAVRQVVQSVRTGELRVLDVPRPSIGATQVLVATSHSVLSAGTEKAVRELATASLLAKARARPELMRQVVRKARHDGVRSTLAAVRTRLEEEMPLGYSGAGSVVEVGEAVSGVVPGQRVATGSAGHAEIQVVPAHLAVPVPEGVTNEEAAFATIGAIALHGLRLADVSPGSKLCVIGLGLLGQLAVRLGLAAGHDVVALDIREDRVNRAANLGALTLVDQGDETTRSVLEWTRGRGVDAALLTAATPSSEPIQRVPAVARDRATIVVVGDVGVELQRTPFYEKELTVRFARSYGPGRYERSYEDWAVDYPPGYVRWSEGRNLEAFLDLLAGGHIRVTDLITHRFPIDKALAAYRLVEQDSEPYLGIQLTYGPPAELEHTVQVVPRRTGGLTIGLLGAGNFVRTTLMPAIQKAGFANLAYVASASGISAQHLAERVGAERVTSRSDVVIDDPSVDTVMIATPHDTHAALTLRALEAGKHVFCEKPLALADEELLAVITAWRANPGQLMVGFNRRWSPAIQAVRERFRDGRGPLVLNYRVSAGKLPPQHWYHDRRQGGRLLGEVCHFIDTCNAIVGKAVVAVATLGSGRSEVLLEEDLVVVLRYEDGSVATIAYSSEGHPATSKERLEVFGRGHSALVEDFRRTVIDERVAASGLQDKGHVAQLTAFRRAIESDGSGAQLTEPAFLTMATTLAAVESLRTGQVVAPSGAPFTTLG